MPEPSVSSSAVARLNAIGRTMRGLLLVERTSWIVVAVLLALAALILTDYALHLPSWARWIWLLVGTSLVAWLLWSRLRPVVNFRPPPEQLALLVERTQAGKTGGLRDVLASGVGLSGTHPQADVVSRASTVAERVSVWSVVSPRGAALAGGSMLACAMCGVMILALSPTMTLIGVQRALLPWTSAQWPKREDLRDITTLSTHPLGQALPLRAALVRGPKGEAAEVNVRYRLVGPAGPTPWREVGAAYQGRLVEVPLRDELDTMREPRGPLFERLLEPTALIADPANPTEPATLEYRFSSSDDKTEVQRVRLIPPPAITGATVTITPPAYATGLTARVAELGSGSDERAIVNGVLPGSSVKVEMRFSKPVTAPEDRTARLGADADALLSAGGKLDADAMRWTLEWQHRQSVRLVPRPIDEAGLTVVGDPAFSVELREDKAPESIVTVPPQDTEALATAVLPVAGQSRDDVGLASSVLLAQIKQRPAGSAGAPVEPIVGKGGEPVELARQEAAATDSPLSMDVRADLDIGNLNVRPGQEVWVTVLAQDRFELDGQRRAAVASPARVIRIVNSEQMLEQLWSELGNVRRSAQRIGEQQTKMAERTKAGADPAEASKEAAQKQPEIAEQLARATEAIERVAQRARENKLQDAELGEIVRQAAQLAEGARQDANSAGQNAQDAQREQNAARQEAARQQAVKSQQAAADKLDQLAEALDRGQDTWAARRSIERLVRDQQALREQSAKLGEETLGKAPEELSPEQQQKLSEAADQQEALARRADEAFRKLDERAAQTEKNDPAAAASLRDAAKQARQSGASEQMQQAARSARRNQQQSAQQSQQKAEQALKNVLDKLRDQAKSRDAVLRRQLASLQEAIDALIARQSELIDQLAAAPTNAEKAKLDGSQIRLNTATVAATQQARDAGREARTVARLLEEASAEQSKAVVALRAKPEADGAAADIAMRAAKAKLEEAKAEAAKQQQDAQQRDQRRQREEIKRAYETLLVEATALRTESADLINVDLDRRACARARGLAERHETLLTKLAEIQEQTAELKDAQMFVLAHERLDDAGKSAATGLRAERVPTSVKLRQVTTERVLRQLIEALTDQELQPPEFRENQAGQQSSSGGQQGSKPLIPPITELRLLRSMQDEALTLTREANESKDATTASEASKLQQKLVDRGTALIKAMERESGGPGGGPKITPIGPKDEEKKEEPKPSGE